MTGGIFPSGLLERESDGHRLAIFVHEQVRAGLNSALLEVGVGLFLLDLLVQIGVVDSARLGQPFALHQGS